jgi:nickel/cobalt tolerance cation efflux system protein
MLDRALNATLRFSIARRWLIVAAAIVISLWGLVAIRQMPLDVFPPFAPPQVDVQTTTDGLSPEEVEARITLPIEAAVNGLPGVDTVRSSSKVGLSMVQVVFDQNADIEKARQAVAERLLPIRTELPANASAPEISPLVSPLGTILQYAFTLKGSGPTTALELRRLVRSSFENQLLEIPGVAQVTLYGGSDLQQQIWVDPEALRRRNVSLQAVADAAAEASATAPGGFLISGGQETLIRVDGIARSGDDLAQATVNNGDGQPLTLMAQRVRHR